MKTKETCILVIEDETAISMAIRDELEFEGFSVEVCQSGDEGLRNLVTRDYDLVILDLVLPKMSGFEICRAVREKGLAIPIIMLTARSDEVDRVRGLDLGADDYVTKPFSLAELLARVRAVLRRYGGIEGMERLFAGELRIDTRKHQAFKGNRKLELTHKEFQLLEMLLKHPGEVISRDEFLDVLWGEEVYVTPRTVDTHMASLRRKVEDDPHHPRYIISIRGAGYKLSDEVKVGDFTES
jgi:DNA-binding response OmpR family regulator